MKTLIFTTAIIIHSFSMNAQQCSNNYQLQGASVMTISTYNNANIFVVVDGSITSATANSITLNFTGEGNHQLTVYKNVFLYNFIRTQEEIHSGNIYIQPNYNYAASIDNYGRMNIVQNYNYNNNFGYNNTYNHNIKYKKHCNNSMNNNYSNYTGYRNNNYSAMSNNEFQQLKNTIESKSFDSSKEQIAKQAMQYNHLSAGQVADLLNVFSFESTKLNVAKAAYTNCVDKQNYYLVTNSFSFSSSVDELLQYIKTN